MTVLKGFAIILYCGWLLFGLVFGFQEFLAAVYRDDAAVAWVAWSQFFGWWQFAVYGAWIIVALFGLYACCRAVGEWAEGI